MTYLLDTHVILWLVTGDSRLKPSVLRAMEQSESNRWSIVSLWEIAIKSSHNRPDFKITDGWQDLIPKEMEESGIQSIGISPAHCHDVSLLTWHHKDPFDRLLIATAISEGHTIISCDRKFRDYPVDVLW